jgi:uncharacterized protein YyaL (SSP411 family)
LAELRRTFVPNRILVVSEEAALEGRTARVPLLAGKVARDGKATVYVCKRRLCALPTSQPEVFARQLREVERFDAASAGDSAPATPPR